MIDRPVSPPDFQRTFEEVHATLRPGELAPGVPLAVLSVENQPLAIPNRV